MENVEFVQLKQISNRCALLQTWSTESFTIDCAIICIMLNVYLSLQLVVLTSLTISKA